VKRIVIFAATSWEMKAVRSAFAPGVEGRIDGAQVIVCTAGGREYWLARTGVGLENARQVAARLLAHQSFSLAVSTGFACALFTVEIGALLVGCDVVLVGTQGSEQSCAIDVPGIERDALLRLVEGAVQSAHIGRFVSTDRIIGSAMEKGQFARTIGAIGLDIESAALAIEAQRAQVPFVIVRAASDLLDENLPLDFNLFLRPTGWLKGIAAVLGAPSSLWGLSRLRRQSQAAAKTLTRFFRCYAAAMAIDEAEERSSTNRL
jgi:adenosylhomocysteine nucleosidase